MVQALAVWDAGLTGAGAGVGDGDGDGGDTVGLEGFITTDDEPVVEGELATGVLSTKSPWIPKATSKAPRTKATKRRIGFETDDETSVPKSLKFPPSKAIRVRTPPNANTPILKLSGIILETVNLVNWLIECVF